MIGAIVDAIIDAIAYVLQCALMLTYACACVVGTILMFAHGSALTIAGGFLGIAFACLCVKRAFVQNPRDDNNYVDNATHAATMRAHGIAVDDDDCDDDATTNDDDDTRDAMTTAHAPRKSIARRIVGAMHVVAIALQCVVATMSFVVAMTMTINNDDDATVAFVATIIVAFIATMHIVAITRRNQ